MKRRLLTIITASIISTPYICLGNSCGNSECNDIVCENKEQASINSAFYSFQFNDNKPDKMVFDAMFLIQKDETPVAEKLRINNNPVIRADGSFTINISFVHEERPQEQKHIEFDIYFEWSSNGNIFKQTIHSLVFYYNIKIIPPENTTEEFAFLAQDNLNIYQTTFGPFKLCDETISADSLIPFIRQEPSEEQIGDVFASITISKPYFYVGLYIENAEKADEGTYTFSITISSNSEQIYEGYDYLGEIFYETSI